MKTTLFTLSLLSAVIVNSSAQACTCYSVEHAIQAGVADIQGIDIDDVEVSDVKSSTNPIYQAILAAKSVLAGKDEGEECTGEAVKPARFDTRVRMTSTCAKDDSDNSSEDASDEDETDVD